MTILPIGDQQGIVAPFFPYNRKVGVFLHNCSSPLLHKVFVGVGVGVLANTPEA